MRSSKLWMFAAGALAMLLAHPAAAGTKVQGNMVPVEDGADVFNIAKPGKFAAKETTDLLSGGLKLTLKLKGIDCPPNNEGDKTGKCNGTDHVMVLTTAFGGSTTETHTGILYDVVAGAALFQANGTNTVDGEDVFGTIAAVVQGQTLGIGTVRARATGSDPGDCAVPVLLPGNGCDDGEQYAVSGVIPSDEPGTGPPCTLDSDCDTLLPQLECAGGACTLETCTQDTDCHLNGINPAVQCDEDAGTCCNVPSTTCDDD